MPHSVLGNACAQTLIQRAPHATHAHAGVPRDNLCPLFFLSRGSPGDFREWSINASNAFVIAVVWCFGHQRMVRLSCGERTGRFTARGNWALDRLVCLMVCLLLRFWLQLSLKFFLHSVHDPDADPFPWRVRSIRLGLLLDAKFAGVVASGVASLRSIGKYLGGEMMLKAARAKEATYSRLDGFVGA